MKRSRFAQLLALLAVLLGMVDGLAEIFDDARTHVVCPEHGDVVEIVAAAVTSEHATRPELRSTTEVSHHEACLFAGFAFAGTLGPLPTPTPGIELPAPEPAPGVILAAAPSRGPPDLLLHTAPKTDPPRA